MGKKKVKAPDEVDGNVNMSPMIDCCFLLLIFFVVNATQITVAKDPTLSMPQAYKPGKMEDAKGCIVVNVYTTAKIMEERKNGSYQKFVDNGFNPQTRWSTPHFKEKGDTSATSKYVGYTTANITELKDYIEKQKKFLLTQPDMTEEKIRVYIRADVEADWSDVNVAVQCAAEAGVTNIVYGTLPTKD